MQNKKDDDKDEGRGPSLKGLSFAYRISSELLAALIVSVILGLLIDKFFNTKPIGCLLYTSPSPRDLSTSRMPSSA